MSGNKNDINKALESLKGTINPNDEQMDTLKKMHHRHDWSMLEKSPQQLHCSLQFLQPSCCRISIRHFSSFRNSPDL